MDVPAQIVVAKIVIVFGPAANDGIQRIEAKIPGFAQQTPQDGIFESPAQSPDGINEGKPSHFVPRRTQVPDLMALRRSREIQRWIAYQQSVVVQRSGIVIRQRRGVAAEFALSR